MRSVVVAFLLLASLHASPASAVHPWHPSQLTHLEDSRQVVVVTSASWRSSYATLRAYGKDADGLWHLRFGPWRARVGYAGMAPAASRRQNTGTTPAGTFRMLWAFGSRADPGTRLERYVRFDRSDWWPYDPRDPRTYNVFQRFRSPYARWRRTQAEHLVQWAAGAYRYSVVLDYNLPSGVHWSTSSAEYVADQPASARKGGGIFLHANGRGATAGCVSIRVDRMRRVLRWLDAAEHPRIVIGPSDVIDRM